MEKMSDQERAVIVAERLKSSRLMNGFKDISDLSKAIGLRNATLLIRAENEERRLPTSSLVNLAADTYRVSTDYLYGRIKCSESEDDQLMRLGLIHELEGIGSRLVRFMGERIGNVASDYLESVQPLGLGVLIEGLEGLFRVTDATDLPESVRNRLVNIRLIVNGIQDERAERQQRIQQRIQQTKKNVEGTAS